MTTAVWDWTHCRRGRHRPHTLPVWIELDSGELERFSMSLFFYVMSRSPRCRRMCAHSRSDTIRCHSNEVQAFTHNRASGVAFTYHFKHHHSPYSPYSHCLKILTKFYPLCSLWSVPSGHAKINLSPTVRIDCSYPYIIVLSRPPRERLAHQHNLSSSPWIFIVRKCITEFGGPPQCRQHHSSNNIIISVFIIITLSFLLSLRNTP